MNDRQIKIREIAGTVSVTAAPANVTMDPKVLRFEHHLNASKTKTLTMGLDVNTLQTIITLSGWRGREVPLLPKS